VTREQINQHFGKSYKQQLLRAPFYGLSQGMTPQDWWKEVKLHLILSLFHKQTNKQTYYI
jgi:hypothetical protein